MKMKKGMLFVVMAGAAIYVSTGAVAAQSRKLAAPIYPGAVPGVLAAGLKVDPLYTANFGGVQALDCSGLKESRNENGKQISAAEAAKEGMLYVGPWCFLSRDPIDKVKAYYDKNIGTMQAVQGEWNHKPVTGYVVLAERAWSPGGDESSPGFYHRAVSVHALPPPPVKSQEPATATDEGEGWEGQEGFQFYAETRHFGVFIDSVDWFGDPSKHKPAELDAVYKKYNYLESAFFQRKGPKSENVDDILAQHYGERSAQAQQAAMMGTVSAQMQMGMAAAQQAPTTTSEDDAEFNAIMKRKPDLARKYVALTQKANNLTMQGRFDEADAVLEEVDALEKSDPELAAWSRKQEAKSAGAQAASTAQEDKIRAAGAKQMDSSTWGNAMGYLKAIDKDAYYTLIVIDNGYAGTEKDYTRDRAVLAKDTQAQKDDGSLATYVQQDLWGIHYASDAASTSSQGSSTSTENAPAEEPAQPKSTVDKLEGVGDAAKNGLQKLKSLKKWF